MKRPSCPSCATGRAAAAQLTDRSPLEPMVAMNLLVDEDPGQVCLRCGGMWVPRADWKKFVRTAEEAAPAVLDPILVPPPVTRRESLVVRACPRCRRGMVKQHFGRRSGVLVDVCYRHGVWLDAGELRAVRLFIVTGGLQLSRTHARGRDDFHRWEALWARPDEE